MEPWKFSISVFQWIFMFSEVLNPISLYFFKKMSVCLCVTRILWASPKTNGRNYIKFYIALHLHINWYWLNFGAYLSRSSAVVRNFRFLLCSFTWKNWVQLYPVPIISNQSFWNLKHLITIAIGRLCIFYAYVRVCYAYTPPEGVSNSRGRLF